MISTALVVSLLAASPVLGLVRSPKPTFVDNSYVINDDARFAYNLFFNFTGATKLPDGLYTSVYTVGEGTHQYTTGNVNVAGGYLQVKVPGPQKSMPYTGGEVATTEDRIFNKGVRKIHFTNQDANGDGSSTYKGVTPPSSPTSTEHEYRIDWTEVFVRFYIDGSLIWETQSDVPSAAGPWIFNNWSNGDKGWSVGPPKSNAIFKIKDIDIYYDLDWSQTK
ncbi:glycoside hydrolase family 16 protein [Colletotrichum kahawae]|uniref:Glycoside hydrolase family 16 protein n=1 Tax=Colletotrichum kahawae TaxID=34407 RepID=A0AAD9XWV6_COLKA|nr:glycoside hydrolase family 16 protein [Colletotrichum kahawae]